MLTKYTQGIPTRITTRPSPQSYILPTLVSKYFENSQIRREPLHRDLVQIVLAPLQSFIKPSNTGHCKAGLLNARSVMNKSEAICDHINDNHLDFLAITETWIPASQRDDPSLGVICPPRYSLQHVSRRGKRGGGVAIIYKDSFTCKVITRQHAVSFECLEVYMSDATTCLRVLVLYRPPPSSKNSLTKGMFFEEFSNLLECHTTSSGKLLILGDFNFHWECSNDPDTSQLRTLLASYNLVQHVTGATHVNGHCLDLVISRLADDLVISTDVSSLVSDHHAVHSNLRLQKPTLSKKSVSFRKYKEIDPVQFRADLLLTSLFRNPASTLDELVTQYNSCIREIVDLHAPLKTKFVTSHPPAPWFTPEIVCAKKERRKCEERWRKTGLVVHREIFTAQRTTVNNMICASKKMYYNKMIHECPDQKSLFQILKNLLYSNKPAVLPDHESTNVLLQQFSDFFESKITKIRTSLDATYVDMSNFPSISTVQPLSYLSALHELSVDDVNKLIKSSPSKSCNLDPIPTWLLKEHSDIIGPVITKIINLSLSLGQVPCEMKLAHVKPILKKSGLDSNNLKNYRPVSNLTFISKLVEKVVDSQFSSHLDVNNLLPSMQSAYRPKHSVETALLRVQNDILRAVDESQGVILVLLDLSAAFDTIDHELLLSKLENMGITDSALSWVKSYLTDRQQVICIQNETSSPVILKHGVPQGSVKGPKDFICYTPAIQAIAEYYGVSVHLYADDTQLYLPFSLASQESAKEAVAKMELCVKHISSWMITNKLQLNADKTELIIISSPRQKDKVSITSLNICDTLVTASTKAKNLGVVFDQALNMKDHITQVCSSINFYLRKIGRVRKYLSQSSAEALIHALISSRLDGNNALLYGLPDSDIQRLQRLQNNAARIVSRSKKSEHITPVLKSLHWLPVHSRIVYKILLLTFKALHGEAPSYLVELLVPYVPTRQLRSSNAQCISIPRTRLRTYGDRAFSKAAPALWNSLPVFIKESQSISTFKTTLKTHLFKNYYNV